MECSSLHNFIKAHSSSVIFFNLRLSQAIRKISGALHGIETSLLSYDVELDDLMIERERKINLEFARRFSRNNLYSIHLKISKLENEIVAFRSYRCCKLSKAVILRTLILSLVSHLARSMLMYEKFLRKSNLKCLLKLDDLMDYLRSTFQIIAYVVDTTSIETLDVTQTISLVLKLSRERKCRIHSTDSTIKNKKPFCENKKVRFKLSQDKKQFVNKNITWSTKMSKRSMKSNNKANTRQVLDSHTGSLFYREKSQNENSTFSDNSIILKEKKPQKYSPMKLQKFYFELCNNVMHHLIVEVSNDMTECISNLILDAYKHELVNNTLR